MPDQKYDVMDVLRKFADTENWLFYADDRVRWVGQENPLQMAYECLNSIEKTVAVGRVET
jgi:hypothetical protein